MSCAIKPDWRFSASAAAGPAALMAASMLLLGGDAAAGRAHKGNAQRTHALRDPCDTAAENGVLARQYGTVDKG